MTNLTTMTTRRHFLRRSLQQSAGLALGTAVPYIFSSVQPLRAEAPSDRIRLGCIGVGCQGKIDARDFSPHVDIAALCDVDSSHLDFARNDSRITRGKKVDTYKDYRKILDRKDINLVSIVTPDHWHVKIAIEALLAGKHVFCQKPLSLTIEENQLIRAACKKSDRVFAVGTQQRSAVEQFMTAILMVQKGLLGDIKKVTCCLGGGKFCPPIPKGEVPAELDYEKWTGPAPFNEYIATPDKSGRAWIPEDGSWPQNSRTHFEFRWWYEYSGGAFTDWGAHHIDIALWLLGQNGPGQGPVSFNPLFAEHPVPFEKGYPTVTNQYNTAMKFDIECKFAEIDTVMRVVSNSPDGGGILLEGTKGRIHVNRERIKGKPFEEIGGKYLADGYGEYYQNMPELQKVLPYEDYVKLYKGKTLDPGDGAESYRKEHKVNVIRCIKEGGLPVSDVFTHTQTMNACHLCAISARLGREVKWDPKTEKTGDTESQSFIARKRRKGYEIES
ncbi:MAG: Gfo/Idh/MocA family oxidoreductase [Planctomycetaceae bacterium]|jgi:predicted dehydrogenase|nr:Gfo/Idh/MocA family oxidoreductase [Planctomycetaceae bacterium]